MQEFLNPSLKPYNALTREEKHILLDAMIDGNCEYYGMRSGTYNCSWYEKESEAFDTDMIYRTKPKEYKNYYSISYREALEMAKKQQTLENKKLLLECVKQAIL